MNTNRFVSPTMAEAVDNLAALIEEIGQDATPDVVLALEGSIRSNLDDVVRGAVHGARYRGDSWQQIGTALGVSKQAAHERYGATDVLVR